MRGAAKCVIDVTVCHWCHPVIDVTVSLMSLMPLCHWCHHVTVDHWCHWCCCIINALCHCVSLTSLCVTDVTMSVAPYKSLCSYHILISSVIYLSDEGLTLGTSALKLFTMANLCYQPVDDPKLPYYTLPLTQHHSFFRNVYYWTVAQCNMEMKQYFPFIWWSSLIIYILVTPAVLQVKARFMWMESLYMEMLLGLIVIL